MLIRLKFKLTILLTAIILIIVIVGILAGFGVLNIPGFKTFFGEKISETDFYLMESRDAYDLALLKARAWQPDASLARITSLVDETGPNGRSDNWDLKFVSKNLKGKGYHIIIRNKEISFAEEINFFGVGAGLPENVISAKEAISRIHQIKGYENEEIISVEMVYGPDGKQWYWGIKTSKGVITINAKQ